MKPHAPVHVVALLKPVLTDVCGGIASHTATQLRLKPILISFASTVIERLAVARLLVVKPALEEAFARAHLGRQVADRCKLKNNYSKTTSANLIEIIQ